MQYYYYCWYSRCKIIITCALPSDGIPLFVATRTTRSSLHIILYAYSRPRLMDPTCHRTRVFVVTRRLLFIYYILFRNVAHTNKHDETRTFVSRGLSMYYHRGTQKHAVSYNNSLFSFTSSRSNVLSSFSVRVFPTDVFAWPQIVHDTTRVTSRAAIIQDDFLGIHIDHPYFSLR